MATILHGTTVRDEIRDRLKAAVTALTEETAKKPTLAIVQVGDNPESTTYIKQKKTFGAFVGVLVMHFHFKDDITQEDLIAEIKKLNTDKSIHGIIVQMPLPAHLNKAALIDAVAPEKDVDGLTATSIKKVYDNDPAGFVPATAKGIIALLDFYKVPLEGKKVVMIGRSDLVGKPTALLCLNRNATVTICHSKTPLAHIKEETMRADIIIIAIGKARFLDASFLKIAGTDGSRSQTIIDVGISVIDKKLVGDADFAALEPLVGAITPVPGGVGPLTVASLFENVVQAAGVRV